jgi:hypothetical protein
MNNDQAPEIARAIPVPYEWDDGDGPELSYGLGPTALFAIAKAGEPIRITFMGLDAIRICRGEYLPYREDETEEQCSLLFIVENSRWLRERYEYEARHYGDCYEFGGDVNEMLTDYDHYLFQFHDDFVEAIAAGIWFEKQATPFTNPALAPDHPARHLPLSTVTELYEVAGIRCQVRTNPKPIEEILRGAFYCSQPLYNFAPERDRFMDVEYSLRVRARRGISQSHLWGFASKPLATMLGVATLEQAKAMVEPFIRRISETRGEGQNQG